MTGAVVTRETGVKRALVLAAAFAMLVIQPTPARADDPSESGSIVASLTPAAEASDESGGVTVQVTRGNEGLEVEGRCRVEGSRGTAWSVLTDYDGISRFVSSMRESRVTVHGDGFLLVEQVAVGRLLLFSRSMHVTLRVTEEPHGRIRFEDVLRRDFDSYRGEWRIEGSGHDTEIVYHVTARPTSSIPDFIARGMFKRTVRDLISQVAAEIRRRQALNQPQDAEPPPVESGRSNESEGNTP